MSAEPSMDERDPKQVKAFWEGRAGQASLSEQEVTHRDVWQRWLEIQTIKPFVTAGARVLDVGCGNGYTTKQLAPLVGEIIGMDYGEEMIRRAVADNQGQGTARETISFRVGDVLELNPATFGMFDVVISERCLINLGSWADQQRAIANIASVIQPGGRFIFLEGRRDGRDQLNALRKSVGLEEMPAVWHNIDFQEAPTLVYLQKWFDVEHQRHFGVYDFIARVVHPLSIAPAAPQYEARINQVAAKLALTCQEFGTISRVLFLVLRRRAA